jgi:hypothetical protein
MRIMASFRRALSYNLLFIFYLNVQPAVSDIRRTISYVGPITPDGRVWSSKIGEYVTNSAIVSLTTVPGREDTLRETLTSLLDQTVSVPILLALPRRSIRFKSKPYLVSAWLHDMPGVYIHRCQDMGPATKVLAAVDFVAAITNVSVRIITVDDDLVRNQGPDDRPYVQASGGRALNITSFESAPDLFASELRRSHSCACAKVLL